MPATSIIQRRDLEPLWAKAGEIVRHYERAGDCASTLISADYASIEQSKHPQNGVFCALCQRYHSGDLGMPSSENPCAVMHRSAIQEALKMGSSYIYTCRLGFFFWASPFFSMERFAGSVISSGPMAIEKEQVLQRVYTTCKGDVSRAEISGHLECLPEKKLEDIEALAQMLTLCSEQLSMRETGRTDFIEFDGNPNLGCWSDGYYDCLPREYLPTLVDRERLLLANLRRGDSAEAQQTARELLNDLCDALGISAVDANAGRHFEYFKLKAIEMVVLLSRAGADEEKNEILAETNIQNLKKIRAAKTANEVIDNFCLAVERMIGKIFSFQGIRHASALRKAERFIWDNYTRKVSLKEIADVSGLSAPYFSTIFKEEMHENLSDYLNRMRVEKASTMLLETDLLVSEISSACGFEDQSWFSKIFKNHTGISPCKYRRTVGVAAAEILPLEQNFKERQVNTS